MEKLIINEGEQIESDPSSDGAEKNQEHPNVEWRLQLLRVFNARPEFARQKIEAVIRDDFPLTGTEQEFLMAIVGIEEQRPFFLRFLEFKTEFLKVVPGCPKKDHDFLDFVETKFHTINASLEEMMYSLHSYLDDPRRRSDRWQGHFARNAFRFLPGYILGKRRLDEQARRRQEAESARQTETRAADAEAPAAPTKPTIEHDPACGPIIDALRQLLRGADGNDGRYGMWFDGKVRFTRNDDGVQVHVPNQFLQNWLRDKFGAIINAAVSSATGSPAVVKFVIDPELLAPAMSPESADNGDVGQPAAQGLHVFA